MKKKAAICISGHLRSYKQGFEKLTEYIIEPNLHLYDFDIFIDTWGSHDWRGEGANNDINDELRDIISLYNPLNINIQKAFEFDTSIYRKFIKPGHVKKNSFGEHIPSMFYKIFKCNHLKIIHENELNFTYDVVFRYRSDFAITKKLLIHKFSGQLSNTIFLAKNSNPNEPIWYSDVFSFSSTKNIDFYSSLFLNLNGLVYQNEIFRPEPLLYHHLNSKQNIEIRELEYDWTILKEAHK